MPAENAHVGRDEAQLFYEDFSLGVGLRDWLVPNPRHEQLKLHLANLLQDRRGLRILDFGCGAGVMTQHLCRYGTVKGIDFSHRAVRAARKLAFEASFETGSLDVLLPGDRYDLVTLFDVLEHIPQPDRERFLSGVRGHLTEDGLVFASTPFPAFTRHRRETGDEALQVIDEQIELPQVLEEAARADLQLIRFAAYDVFAGSPEYQMMIFAPQRQPGEGPRLRSPELQRRTRQLATRRGRRLHRARNAARLLAHGERSAARWFLTGVPPRVKS